MSFETFSGENEHPEQELLFSLLSHHAETVQQALDDGDRENIRSRLEVHNQELLAHPFLTDQLTAELERLLTERIDHAADDDPLTDEKFEFYFLRKEDDVFSKFDKQVNRFYKGDKKMEILLKGRISEIRMMAAMFPEVTSSISDDELAKSFLGCLAEIAEETGAEYPEYLRFSLKLHKKALDTVEFDSNNVEEIFTPEEVKKIEENINTFTPILKKELESFFEKYDTLPKALEFTKSLLST